MHSRGNLLSHLKYTLTQRDSTDEMCRCKPWTGYGRSMHVQLIFSSLHATRLWWISIMVNLYANYWIMSDSSSVTMLPTKCPWISVWNGIYWNRRASEIVHASRSAESWRTNALHFKMRLWLHFRCDTFLKGWWYESNWKLCLRKTECWIECPSPYKSLTKCSVSPKTRVVAELAASVKDTPWWCGQEIMRNWLIRELGVRPLGQSDGNACLDTTNRSSSCEPCDVQSMISHRRWPLRAFVIIESRTNVWGRQLMRMTAVVKWNGAHLSVIGR